MSHQIDISVTNRVKELLKITEEVSLIELFNRLKEFRNDTHPDGITDEHLRKEAEERCKLANSLLDELEKQVEIERLNLTSTQLATYKPLYDAHRIQRALDKAEVELIQTKEKLEQANEENKTLNGRLDQNQEKLIEKEIEYLQSIYKPSPKKFAVLGIAVALPFAISVMAQMEKISTILGKYSPFGIYYITSASFLVMVCFLLMLLREIWQGRYISQRSEEVRSSEFAMNLLVYLKNENSSVSEFSEVKVFKFIFGGESRLKTCMRWLGFTIFRSQTINLLTNIAINNLLVKKLVKISRANEMQRYFAIIGESSQSEIYQRYWLESAAKGRDLESQLAQTRLEIEELKRQ